jgi:hypothetical protein
LGQTVTNPEVATIAASTGLPDDSYSLFNSVSPLTLGHPRHDRQLDRLDYLTVDEGAIAAGLSISRQSAIAPINALISAGSENVLATISMGSDGFGPVIRRCCLLRGRTNPAASTMTPPAAKNGLCTKEPVPGAANPACRAMDRFSKTTSPRRVVHVGVTLDWWLAAFQLSGARRREYRPQQIGLLFYPRMLYFAQRRPGW